MSTTHAYPMTPIRTPAPNRGRSPFTLESLDFEPGCEHQYHGHDKRHYGPAAWLQNGLCPHCGEDLNALVCDRWRKTVSEWARTNYKRATCPSCLTSFPAREANFTFTRI